MIGKNVRKIRIAKGVKATHIASVISKTTRTYSSIEKGTSKINAEDLNIISKVLQVPVEVFFDNNATENYINVLNNF